MSTSIKVTSTEQSKGCLKVAFATNDGTTIDAHFGSAKQFSLYSISKECASIHKIIKIEEKDTENTISLLKDVDIVYFMQIGPTAAAKIINKGIFPIKYKEPVSIEDEINKLIKMLDENPPPFIKKIIAQKAA